VVIEKAFELFLEERKEIAKRCTAPVGRRLPPHKNTKPLYDGFVFSSYDTMVLTISSSISSSIIFGFMRLN
jgi:hypothetical protein